MSFFRRREALFGLGALAIFLVFSALFHMGTVSSSTFDPESISRKLTSSYSSSSHDHDDPTLNGEEIPIKTAGHPLHVLAQLYEDERVALLKGYDQSATEALILTPAGHLDPDFNKYIARLEGFVNKYFVGTRNHDGLIASLNNLVDAKPSYEQAEFDKVIYSFDKEGAAGVPSEFSYWHKRLESSGWDIRVADDGMMEEWYDEVTERKSDGHVDDAEAKDGRDAWNEMWHGLERPVLKSDLLRYMLMLAKGGLYTDSDTAPLSDLNFWGTHAHDLTPRALSALQRAMRHLDPSHPSYQQTISKDGSPISPYSSSDDALPKLDLDFASNPVAGASRGINNPRVNLVVSVEYDVKHPRQDPRYGYTRDLQIVQWTFMAKRHHPVFLDVLERATTEIMTRRAAGQHHNDWNSILDVTGPAQFTDAVLRYLLVQYGVNPEQLVGMEDGALIGDVLILPLHAFGSYHGGEEDWNAHDPSTRCTAHGFRGRWKGGIGFDENAGRRKRSLFRRWGSDDRI